MAGLIDKFFGGGGERSPKKFTLIWGGHGKIFNDWGGIMQLFNDSSKNPPSPPPPPYLVKSERPLMFRFRFRIYSSKLFFIKVFCHLNAVDKWPVEPASNSIWGLGMAVTFRLYCSWKPTWGASITVVHKYCRTTSQIAILSYISIMFL